MSNSNRVLQLQHSHTKTPPWLQEGPVSAIQDQISINLIHLVLFLGINQVLVYCLNYGPD